MNTNRRPLDDITVLDLTQALSGPICTAILADYGATVVKIESPKGTEITRGSCYNPNITADPIIGGDNYNSINRNKYSVALDLRSDEGKEILKKLAVKADVIVSNYRPGVTKLIGADYESLSKINPRIICAEIAGFREKARENEPAFDVVIQAASGILASTGYPDQPPAKVSASVCDMSAGLHMVQGIMFALYERAKTGKGQAVNVRMQDAAMFMLAQYVPPCITIPEFDLKRNGMSHIEATPSSGYKTADGYIFMALGSDKLFARFCEMVERPDIYEDPRFNTGSARLRNRDELNELLDELFSKKTAEEWYKELAAAGLPASPILTPKQAFTKAYEEGLDIIQTVQHPLLGKLPVIGTVCEMSETPGRVTKAGPFLGYDTMHFLKELADINEDEVAALEAKGVVRCYK